MAVRIIIIGHDELLRKLQGLSGFLSSSGFRAILEDTGSFFVDLAKKDAPVSKNPGAKGLVAGAGLRSSIRYQVLNFGTPEVRISVKAGGPNAPYAPYVEFGTKDSMRIAINRQTMFWMEDGAGRKLQTPWRLMGGMAAVNAKGYMAKFRQIVWHPGTRAQPFFYKQLPIIMPKLLLAMKKELETKWGEGGMQA